MFDNQIQIEALILLLELYQLEFRKVVLWMIKIYEIEVSGVLYMHNIWILYSSSSFHLRLFPDTFFSCGFTTH